MKNSWKCCGNQSWIFGQDFEQCARPAGQARLNRSDPCFLILSNYVGAWWRSVGAFPSSTFCCCAADLGIAKTVFRNGHKMSHDFTNSAFTKIRQMTCQITSEIILLLWRQHHNSTLHTVFKNCQKMSHDLVFLLWRRQLFKLNSPAKKTAI